MYPRKVNTFIETSATPDYYKFLNKSFKFDYLNKMSDYILFEDWKCKQMSDWVKYTNDESVVLEIYAEKYHININSNVIILPYPRTVNEFINDMDRFNIVLYWNLNALMNLKPKDYLNKTEIEDYWRSLLERIDKSFELL